MVNALILWNMVGGSVAAIAMAIHKRKIKKAERAEQEFYYNVNEILRVMEKWGNGNANTDTFWCDCIGLSMADIYDAVHFLLANRIIEQAPSGYFYFVNQKR